jgi:hypothetical protein
MTKQDFKNKVIELIKSRGVDISNKKIRVYDSPRYGLEVRIYSEPVEITNKRSSFRRTTPVYEKDKIVAYEGTRGIHSRKISMYTYLNEKDFEKPSEIDFFFECLNG